MDGKVMFFKIETGFISGLFLYPLLKNLVPENEKRNPFRHIIDDIFDFCNQGETCGRHPKIRHLIEIDKYHVL